jgi:hypothetical protein
LGPLNNTQENHLVGGIVVHGKILLVHTGEIAAWLADVSSIACLAGPVLMLVAGIGWDLAGNDRKTD